MVTEIGSDPIRHIAVCYYCSGFAVVVYTGSKTDLIIFFQLYTIINERSNCSKLVAVVDGSDLTTVGLNCLPESRKVQITRVDPVAVFVPSVCEEIIIELIKNIFLAIQGNDRADSFVLRSYVSVAHLAHQGGEILQCTTPCIFHTALVIVD